jgi:ATP-binding cassette, subfamily F, member 3
MLSLSNIFIQYGNRILLDGVSVVIKPGERVGLVGRNGAGKSTLLKIIAGEMSPQQGDIITPSNFSIGYLHQDMFLPKGKTVLAETMTAFDEALRLDKRLHEIEHELTVRDDYESDAYHNLIVELSETTERLARLGSDTMQADTEKILGGLGFASSDMTRLTDEFSGGWQMRIELAKMLLKNPDMLLLDEPTNHLDIESILWLEDWLDRYQGMAIVISHDKRFLDNVTNRTVEVVLGRLSDYKAPYSKYLELSAERKELMQNAYENQQRVIADRERTINRFMAKATKTKMAQSMQKQLDKMERIEVEDEDTSAMRIRFMEPPRSGEVVAIAERVTKRYGDVKVLENIDLNILRGERIAFVGQNGQGKTTLAKMICGFEPATSGVAKLGHNIHLGYYAQNQAETLDPKLTLVQTMEQSCPNDMRTKIRAILGAFLFSGQDVDKRVSALSGGERARLAMACMLLHPINFLVLDEPTNHLDMLSKDILKQAVMEFEGTLLVVSHDREFLEGLSTRTIEFRNHRLYEYLGDVSYFLEKRKLDNMRDVEMRDKPSASKQTGGYSQPDDKSGKGGVALSAEDKKNLQRVVQRTEKRISELEEAMKKIETNMADTGFYEKPDAQKVMQQYESHKSELTAVMSEWETAVEQLG